MKGRKNEREKENKTTAPRLEAETVVALRKAAMAWLSLLPQSRAGVCGPSGGGSPDPQVSSNRHTAWEKAGLTGAARFSAEMSGNEGGSGGSCA